MINASFWKLSLLICCLVVCSARLMAQEPEHITVYIGPQVRDGFVDMDAGIRDSIRDLQQECQIAGLVVVPNLEKATVALIVLGRGLPVKGNVGFGSAIGGTGSAFVAPHTVPTIATSLRIGSYERTSSREGGNWRHAAKLVVDDLKRLG